MNSDEPTFRDQLAEFFTGPLGFLAELGVWGAASVGLAGIIFVFLGGLKDSPKTRETFETWLTYDTVGQAYRGQLRRVLDWIDGALCSRAELALPAADPRRGWSTKLLSFALVLAFAYPTLSLLVRWTLANNGNVSGLVVLPAEESATLRYTSLGLITISLLCAILAVPRKLPKPRLLLQIFGLAALIGSFALAIAFELRAAASAAAFAVAAAVAFKSAAAIGVAAAVVLAIGASFSEAFATSEAANAAIAFAVATAVVIAVAITVAKKMEGMESQYGWPTLLQCDWAILGLLNAGIVLSLTPSIPEIARGTVLFLSVLPLINGLADFASIGLTRWSLRRGVEGLLPWSSFIDLIGAALIFLALGCGIISFIDVFTPRDGIPLLDLTTLFDELGNPDTRGQYWWLYFTLFSTLIPTILHLIIASIAFFTVYPKFIRKRIAAWITLAPEDAIAARSGRYAMTIALTAAIMIPTMIIVELIRWWPLVLDSTIWLFEGYARMIGAVA